MITVLSALVSLLCFRLRGRSSLELELVALRHQVAVIRLPKAGKIVAFPEVFGLHYRYERLAA